MVTAPLILMAMLSWYGLSPDLDGQPMANGDTYQPWAFTVAAPLAPGTTIPMWALGTELRLCAARAPTPWRPLRRCVDVVVTDTCPGCGQTWPYPWLDASPGVFRHLAGGLRPGILRGISVEALP